MKDRQGAGKKRKILPTLLKLLFSTGLLIYIFLFKTKIGEVWLTLGRVSWTWLVISFSLHAIGLFISAYRWQILIRAQGDEVPLKFLAQSYLVGTFFNNFLPTRFGGDVVRIWDGSRYSQSLTKSSAIVIVERLTGLLILFFFALLVSLIRLDLAQKTPVIWASLGLGTLGFGGVIAFLLLPVPRLLSFLQQKFRNHLIFDKVISFRETILSYRNQRKPFILAMGWALALQFNVIIYYFLIGKALNLSVPFLDYFMVIPVVHFVQLIPVTINGLGLREGAYIEIFSYYSIPAEAAFSFSLVDVAFVLILGGIGGIIYVIRK